MSTASLLPVIPCHHIISSTPRLDFTRSSFHFLKMSDKVCTEWDLIFQRASKVGSEKHPKTHGTAINYGTAGFRTRAELLDHVLYRMGLLAVLRSKAKKATIGVMITASHNPECDNGVKLVDPHGEMLDQSWETLATKLANVDDSEIANVLEDIVLSEKIDFSLSSSVFVGKDTRASSASLSKAALTGVVTLSGTVKDFGVVTTPMLHYFVMCQNTNFAYGEPTEQGYFKKIITAFKKLRGGDKGNYDNGNYKSTLLFDGANGVGALKMQEAKALLGTALDVKIYNDGTQGQLNYQCGADFVKVHQEAPHGLPVSPGARCVSVDGDADRIVYFHTDTAGVFHLLDGDRIATLVAGFLMELVQASDINIQLGLVQTAYANGSSTSYITDTLQVPVACVATGVKYLHHKALEFDIGVYFEANGHGTVTFSQTASKAIKQAIDNVDSNDTQRQAAVCLANVMDVINQTVGDAISDMLLVETVLQARGWDVGDWQKTYTDLPNRQRKVTVRDRRVVETADAERICLAPVGLQEEINKLVKNFTNGRSFVRPSGTEDIVRVYAEADTQTNADLLAEQVANAVYQLAGGIGDRT